MNIRRGSQQERDILWSEHQKLETKGFWLPMKKSDGSVPALIICPKCGNLAMLVNHQITDDGTVTPSVVCPMCNFHEFIKLEDWSKT